MSLFERAFNASANIVGWILRVEPTRKSVLRAERVSRQMRNETLDLATVKVMTRADAEERVRIVQRGSDFGAVVDFDDPKYGWSPEHILAGGIIYASPAQAEAEARGLLSWLKEQPNQSQTEHPEATVTRLQR